MTVGKQAEAMALVSDEVIKEYYLLGSYEECAARVQEYRDAGVTNPLLLPRLEDLRSDLTGISTYL